MRAKAVSVTSSPLTHQRYVFLSHNKIQELPPGLFEKTLLISDLDAHGNQLQTIPTDLHGMKELRSVDLSFNNISHPIGSDTFSNSKLRFVSLAHNRITRVKPSAFGKSLEHAWLTGNNVTCAELERNGALPDGAGCSDDAVCQAREGLTWLGNGFCDGWWDELVDTAACLWDGGDCEK